MQAKRFPLLVHAAACLVTATMAILPAPPTFLRQFDDKIQHGAAFMALTMLAAVVFSRRGYGFIITCNMFLGAIIEFIQLIPIFNRNADINDLIVNCVGILIAIPFAMAYRYFSEKS